MAATWENFERGSGELLAEEKAREPGKPEKVSLFAVGLKRRKRDVGTKMRTTSGLRRRSLRKSSENLPFFIADTRRCFRTITYLAELTIIS